MEKDVSQQAMVARLHAPDRREAQDAVQYFIERRMSAPLIERLKGQGDDVRIQAVRGLAAIGDAVAVPAIADLLEAERRPVSGSEDATVHKILKETALRTASQLSGESFDVDDINDEQAILAVVQRLRAKHGRE